MRVGEGVARVYEGEVGCGRHSGGRLLICEIESE